MTRRWISIRAPWGIRIGQSWSQEDFEPPRLATWQRYEITQMLIDAAVKKGGGMSKERANFIVNKTLALATFWDLPMDHTEAADIVDNAINRRRWLKWFWITAILVAILITIAIAPDVR